MLKKLVLWLPPQRYISHDHKYYCTR